MRQQIHDLEVVWHNIFQQVDCTLADYLPALNAFVQADCINHPSGSSFAKLHPTIDDPMTFIPPLIHIAAALIVLAHIALLLIFLCSLYRLEKMKLFTARGLVSLTDKVHTGEGVGLREG